MPLAASACSKETEAEVSAKTQRRWLLGLFPDAVYTIGWQKQGQHLSHSKAHVLDGT